MGHKAAETTHNINNAFALGTAIEHIVKGWFKKFCKGVRALKMMIMVGGHQKLTMTS